MATLFCTKKFHRYTIDKLNFFINRVENGIYTNSTVFINTPLTKIDFLTIKNAYIAAWAAYDLYGKTKKTQYATNKKELMIMLDLLADYVTDLAKNDISIIVLSGFEPSKSTQLKNPSLQKILFFSAKIPNTSGELLVEVPKLSDSRNIHYYCICSEEKELSPKSFIDGTLQMRSIDHMVYINFNKMRKKHFKGLQSATWYYVYVFASNATSVSPLSDPIKIMVG